MFGVRVTAMEIAEFYRHYELLLTNWYRLPCHIREEVEQVRVEIRSELAGWRPGAPPPNWSSYAERVNRKCREEGVGAVFGV